MSEHIYNSHCGYGVPAMFIFSTVQLKGKHCRNLHCRNGVVDTLEQCSTGWLDRVHKGGKQIHSPLEGLVITHPDCKKIKSWGCCKPRHVTKWDVVLFTTLYQWPGSPNGPKRRCLTTRSPITGTIFETGAYGVPSKSPKSFISGGVRQTINLKSPGKGAPPSTPSWGLQWHPLFWMQY